MRPVAVRILHPEPGAGRRSARTLGRRARGRRWPSVTGRGFEAAGADRCPGRQRAARRYTVRGAAPRPGPADRPGRPRRPRLRARSRSRRARDRRRLRRGRRRGRPAGPRQQPLLGGRHRDRLRDEASRDVPDLPGDNALPRWLAEARGLRGRRPAPAAGASAIDIDGPLDLVLTATRRGPAPRRSTSGRSAPRLAARPRLVAADPRAELLVAGRTSAATLPGSSGTRPSRTRALVEERGLRTGARRASDRRASVLGALLDRDGPASLGDASGRARRRGDHRHARPARPSARRRRSGWPAPEDRFASDLLLPDGIARPVAARR